MATIVSKKLLSEQTLVQAPFITVKMGDNILGTFQNNLKNKTDKFVAPNYINSLRIDKINGSVNRYTIELVYVIYPGADPNLIDKMISSVSSDRKIVISYGDCMDQGNAYRDEEALITTISQKCDFTSPKITYTITAISAAVYLKGVIKDWPARRRVKPSKIIREALDDTQTGLRDVFKGMANAANISRYELIPSDDKEVDIPAYQSMSAFDYIRTLTEYMTPEGREDSFYILQVFDTREAPLFGSHFKISEVGKEVPANVQIGAYDLDIGYPGDNFVSHFEVNTDQQWSILYDYAEKVSTDEWSYTYDNNGNVVKEYSPRITRDANQHRTLENNTNWWKQVTEYPITAKVTIKGLIRPVNLVEYVRLNVIFFGRKSIYSGTYIITKEEDSINSSGVTTVLSLTRVKGETE